MPIKVLKDLASGESGTIVQIEGGQGMIGRLAALDIQPGRRITKLNNNLMGGPVTIELNRTQVAIGFGMAKRILVEVGERGS